MSAEARPAPILASRPGLMAFALALIVVAADQASKAWIIGPSHLALGVPTPVWGPLRLTLVENRGVSFGLFQSDAAWTRWALAAFSLIVAGALAWWVRRAERWHTGLALGLIMGGALGNFADRLRDGVVVDFIDVSALRFPWVFNVADSAITIGVLLLLAENLFFQRPEAA